MQGRGDLGLVLQQGVPGQPFSSVQARMLRSGRLHAQIPPPERLQTGASVADGCLRAPSRAAITYGQTLLLRYRRCAAAIASGGAEQGGAGRLSSASTNAAQPGGTGHWQSGAGHGHWAGCGAVRLSSSSTDAGSPLPLPSPHPPPQLPSPHSLPP